VHYGHTGILHFLHSYFVHLLQFISGQQVHYYVNFHLDDVHFQFSLQQSVAFSGVPNTASSKLRFLSVAFLRRMSPKDPVGLLDIQVLEWAVTIFLSLSGDFSVEFSFTLEAG
jgi:hypothetical protein